MKVGIKSGDCLRKIEGRVMGDEGWVMGDEGRVMGDERKVLYRMKLSMTLCFCCETTYNSCKLAADAVCLWRMSQPV